ncbi:MAG: hypothetical protein GQ582_04255 [Methyloprofundus sp.]|nr:hypothetical protein [Methyloprofundus sp.]
MAFFRCKQCLHMREVSNNYTGKSVKCPQCKTVSQVHDTVAFVESIIKKYVLQSKELKRLQKSDIAGSEPTLVVDNDYCELSDIHNTTELSSQKQYAPIVSWFQEHDIQTDVNHDAVDTTGFFDEIALSLGNQYTVLEELVSKIKYLQQKGYGNAKLPLVKKSKADKEIIKAFCQELYDYSFVTKYFFNQKEQSIHLSLQTVPSIVNFFNGIWMEWFIFIKLLNFFNAHKISNACLRSLDITFSNDDKNELDIFFIANGMPICIECKSGEFRPYIDKYSKLRKRLKMDKSQFLFCVIGLDEKQTQGLSSTYDVTFVNESNLFLHLEKILQLKPL